MKLISLHTLANGNCSFSALYRSMHNITSTKHKSTTHEHMYLIMSRFLFSLVMMKRKHHMDIDKFYKYLNSGYYLGEDEIIYFALFCENKYIVIFRNLNPDHRVFVQPQFYDVFLSNSNVKNVMCFKCDKSHYQHLMVQDHTTMFKLSQFDDAFQHMFLPFMDPIQIPTINHDVGPICVRTTSDFNSLVTNECMHMKVRRKLHPGVIHGLKSVHLQYITEEQFHNLQQLCGSLFNIPRTRLNILLFLETPETKQYAVVMGRFEHLPLSKLSTVQLMHVIRVNIYVQSLFDKNMYFGSFTHLESSGDDVILVLSEKDETRRTSYINARNNILNTKPSDTMLSQYFDECPQFCNTYDYIDKNRPELADCSSIVRDSFIHSKNDLQLLDEIYIRI